MFIAARGALLLSKKRLNTEFPAKSYRKRKQDFAVKNKFGNKNLQALCLYKNVQVMSGIRTRCVQFASSTEFVSPGGSASLSGNSNNKLSGDRWYASQLAKWTNPRQW